MTWSTLAEARCTVSSGVTSLSSNWHTLFDVCPGLLKLDPPDGLNIFRSFMTWAYRNHPPLNWTYYLSVCRWLLTSTYQAQIHEEYIDAFMTAAAARWINTDDSQARGCPSPDNSATSSWQDRAAEAILTLTSRQVHAQSPCRHGAEAFGQVLDQYVVPCSSDRTRKSRDPIG